MKVKNIITIAIFTVLIYVLFRIVSLTALVPFLYPYVPAITLIPCGVIWAYLRVKVPKRYGILIQCTLLAILTFIGGSPWFIDLGLFVGGIAAEIISGIGSYKNFKLNTFGYTVFGLIFSFGSFGVMLLARSYYLNYVESLGMKMDHIESVLFLVTWQTFLLCCVFVVITSTIRSMLLGKRMLKKHFEKASTV
ncbi:hypothetical protein AZF37_02085 [endosymbiont 'TC1' of Trimyema compressum]|uniref:MptD family putative ECF transporter S component n=1 Tax=endosymbiont 'TC1' of Trimyema compressum TaxID=243899 RepID=UPI0007F0DD18|nr:MptD family putative ECF transporter S component [endosymbiont 'TC1' of Trimyema compressum]AMP20125.1 hypothetical protein AZF37_02085 [endosymbiont 'TC1' of Trimyema compressum]